MKSIWKFELDDEGIIDMPKGARPLSVQMQGDVPTMWAQVDTDADVEQRYFIIFGTGHMLPENLGPFIDTFQMPNGLVFHVFDRLQ